MAAAEGSALPPDVAELDDKMLRSLRDAFSGYDPASEGLIAIGDLAAALRVLGLRAPEKDIRALAGGDAAPARIDFITFSSIAAKLRTEKESPAALIAAFQLFDPGNTGTITRAVLMKIFAELGDAALKKMDPETLKTLCDFADPENSGRVNYVTLVNRISEEYAKVEAIKKAAAAGGAKKGGGAKKT